MNSQISIFSAIYGLAIIVDQTIDVTREIHSAQMIERFIANNYYQNWLTLEFVQLNKVNLTEYQNMPLNDEQLCLRFEHNNNYYVENLYFKFFSGWFIERHTYAIYQNKAFVTIMMRNGIAQAKVYLIIEHNGHLISIY